MKKLLILTFLATACLPAWATTRYIAQTAGTVSGGTACNGQTAITPATWNATSESAGDTSYVCGTITGSAGATILTFGWSGSSGSPISLIFDTGSSLQAPYFGSGGAVNINGHTYVTINGQNQGTVEATLNGTSGAACPGGSCSYQQNSPGIEGGASNDTIENLTIGPMYKRSGTTDEAPDALSTDCIDIGTSSTNYSNDTVTGNTLSWCLNGVFYEWGANGGSNLTISHNIIHDTNWSIGTAGCANSTTFTGMFVFSNHTYNFSSWDDTVGNAFHHNSIHAFQCSSSTATVANFYIYNNEFDGPVGDCCVTSQIYIDNNGGNTCFTNGAIFNNVFSWASGDCTGTCGNGQIGLFSGTGWLVANNTMIGNATSNSAPQGYLLAANTTGASATILNNVMTTAVEEIYLANVTLLNSSPDYNLYANSPSSSQVFQHNSSMYSAAQFSSWKTSIAADSHSSYQATNPVPTCTSNTNCSNVIPASGSAVIGAGTNLYSTCNGQPNPGLGALCYDVAGNARPSTGAWTAGAYNQAAAPGGSVCGGVCQGMYMSKLHFAGDSAVRRYGP